MSSASRYRGFQVRARTIGVMVAALSALLASSACSKPSYIELDPSEMELIRRGEVRRVSGRAMNHQGRYFPDIMFEWETLDPSIATVDDRGNVRAESSGRTYVVARVKGLEARTHVLVTFVERLSIPEPEITLSATESRRTVPTVATLDHRGQTITGRRITLTSRDPDIVMVDGRGGLHAQNVGETEILVDSDGVSGVIRVTVTR